MPVQMTRVSRRSAAMATLLGHGTTVAITIVQAFVLVPLCLASLGAPTYGAWLGAAELLMWIQLLDFGLPGLLTQRVGAAIGRGDEGEATRWSATSLVLIVMLAFTLTVIAVAVTPAVAAWVQIPAEHTDVFVASFRTASVASALILVFNGLLGLARGLQRPEIATVAQVAGVVANLVVTVGLLWIGWGLWALAIGLLSRAVISLAGGVWFLLQLRQSRLWLAPPSAAPAREIAGLLPSLAGASVGYLLANNTEVLLVAAVLGPVPAAVYALTRRATDGMRNLLDVFLTAVHGGFSHLVAAEERARTRSVMSEITWLRLAAACTCGAVVLSVNQGFVTLLFGPELYGGLWLTTAFVVQLVVGGHALLYNALLRAAGHVREGSWLLLAEALGRLAVVLATLWLAGMASAPWAAAAVSALAWGFARRRLDHVLPAASEPVIISTASRAVPGVALGAGLVVGALSTPTSWAGVFLTAGTVGAVCAAVLYVARPPGVGRAAWPRLT